MHTLTKCILLPIDEKEESLRPVEFIRRLYPLSEVSLILCYFSPPAPPVYSGAVVKSPDLLSRKKEFYQVRQQDIRRVFDHAKDFLLKEGFAKELIREHVEQRQLSVSKQACLLADVTKVDAVLVQKRVTSSLEGFIRGDPSSALLEHCIRSPVWFTEGEIDPKSAAICIVNEEASLRIADHAGFMLSNTGVKIDLLHATKELSRPLSCLPSEASKVLADYAHSSAGQDNISYLLKAFAILADYGIDENRVRITLIPDKRHTADEILSWCNSSGIGIIGLGHSQPEGIWSFLKTSVTRKILSDFQNMAVWVAQ
jgi:nucleotide-binding universal stress UspA family protein